MEMVLVNKILKIVIPILVFIVLLLISLPCFEIKTKQHLIAIRYKEDYSEFETNQCYNESYYYNEKHNISLNHFNHKQFLFFHIYVFDYKEGNVCETEYLLEESYIKRFIEKAEIIYNDENIDISKLIEGKTAIVGNKRYFGGDYNVSVDNILDGEYETLFVFYVDDMLIIQVGLSDEGPKFIAYK